MRFVALPVVPAVPSGKSGWISPSARTRGERDRSLRDAFVLSCFTALALARLLVALFEAAPVSVRVIEFAPDRGPVIDAPPDVARDPGSPPPATPRRPDDGTLVAAEADTLPVVPAGFSSPETAVEGEPGEVGDPVAYAGVGRRSGEEELPDFGTFVPFDEPPIDVTRVIPEYPEVARQARMEGAVLLQALVAADGRVRDVRVARSAGLFDAPAEAAVRRWRFRPALSNGHPVAVWVAIPIVFTLR